MTAVPSERRRAPRAEDPQLRGRREEPRAYIVLPASTEALSGHFHVRLVDVSRTGARLEGSRLPELGKDVLLKCAGIEAFGNVAWEEAGRCGIRFDEPIGLSDLMALRAVAAESGPGLSPEREAAADWANGLAR